MFATIGMIASISFGVWVIGAIIAWNIYDIEGPKTSNVAAGFIMLFLNYTGKVAGTIFWPFVLVLEVLDYIYKILNYIQRIIQRFKK